MLKSPRLVRQAERRFKSPIPGLNSLNLWYFSTKIKFSWLGQPYQLMEWWLFVYVWINRTNSMLELLWKKPDERGCLSRLIRAGGHTEKSGLWTNLKVQYKSFFFSNLRYSLKFNFRKNVFWIINKTPLELIGEEPEKLEITLYMYILSIKYIYTKTEKKLV